MRCFAFIVLTLALLAPAPLIAAEEKDDICAMLDSIPIAKLREEFKHYENPDEKIKQLLEGPAREEGCRVTYWQAFKAKSARDVLGPVGFGAYERALDQSDCDTAFALLVNAFPAAHPRAPNILDNDRHREQWVVSTVSEQYTEVHFCRLLREKACRSAYWSEFEPRPARELLDAESFQTYETALAQYDCETPLALLANAFVGAYPRAPNILDDPPEDPGRDIS